MSGLVIAGTGHRPHKLGGYTWDNYSRLYWFARNQLRNRPDITQVVSGMALGWDLALAEAAYEIKIPFIAAVPFDGQEKKWTLLQQIKYRRILSYAERVEVVCAGDYDAWKMQRRNEWMVDHCDLVLALWDGSEGGTWNCIQYADRIERPVENLWQDWLQWVSTYQRSTI